jgi:hypothetical protein
MTNTPEENERLEAVPLIEGPHPNSVAGTHDAYWERGCGADVLKTTARLIAEKREEVATVIDPVKWGNEALPAQVIAQKLHITRHLLDGALKLMRAAAAQVADLSRQEAVLLQEASRAAVSGTLPDWARPLVSVQGSSVSTPQDGSERVAYAVGDYVGLPSPYGQSKRYRVEHVQPAQRMAAVILGGQLKWFTFAELRYI